MGLTKHGLTLLAILLFLSTAGCVGRVVVHSPDEESAGEGDLWTKEELYFGTEIPTGGVVTEKEWERFVEEVISPRYPEGFTVIEGEGQYEYENGKIAREKMRIVILYYRDRVEDYKHDVEEIISAYKNRFHQESVLRVTSSVRAKF